MTGLVLASASSGRLDVLRRAGVEPRVVVSGVDEDAVIAALPGAAPSDVVAALATAKARDVASGITSDCVVIGCDSMLLVDGQLRGKPGSVEAARSQWASMAGRSGRLLTGHCVIRIDGDNRHEITETDSTTVHFGTPTAEDLEAYVAGGEPLWVAGGFTSTAWAAGSSTASTAPRRT